MKLEKALSGNFYPRDYAKSLIPKPLSYKNALKKVGTAETIEKGDVSIYDLKAEAVVSLKTSRVLRGTDAKRNILDLVSLAQKRNFKNVAKKVQTSLTNIITQDVLQDVRELPAKKGERIVAEWLPSSSQDPDPDHELNYGEEFFLDEGIDGELPGERFGCKCGFRVVRVVKQD